MTKIALIGFGVVGQAFTEIIRDKHGMLREKYGLDPVIVAISGRSKGSIYDPDGLDLDVLFEKFKETGTLESYQTAVKGY